MKTQIIYLDPHDDLISIRDRMAWAKTPRILLVWPGRDKAGVRPLDLTLLRRHAESLGAELGLVTRNREIRSEARNLGISFFSKAAEAQKKQWLGRQPAHPARRFPRINLRTLRDELPSFELFPFTKAPVRRIIVFAVGVIAVLAVLLVLIPSAEIEINHPRKLQSLTIAVNAVPGIKNVQISGSVPLRRLSITLNGTDSLLATGRTVIPDQAARGIVILMNLTDKAVNVPSGTVLITQSSNQVSFLTDNQIQVPGGKGKTIKGTVHAKLGGSGGNVLAGEVTNIEGSLGKLLAVTNPEPITGGTEHSIPIATDLDHDLLKEKLLSDLDHQARLRFSELAVNGDVLVPSTFTRSNISTETFSPPVGVAGEKLSLTLSVVYTIAYASFTDLHLLAERVLSASLPAGFTAGLGDLVLKPISSPIEEQGMARWQMQAEQELHRYIDSEQVIFIALGKTVEKAEIMLAETYNLEDDPNISIRPNWWPWLPFLPFRIAVTG